MTSPENKLKKEKKAKKISKEEVKTENEKLRFGDSDGESDDEIFTVKRKNVQIEVSKGKIFFCHSQTACSLYYISAVSVLYPNYLMLKKTCD